MPDLIFETDPEIEQASLEAGRKLFAGPCDFLKGVVAMPGLPEADRPEVCFAGRSNVGKSSLINMLTGRKALARTSKQPGKTQHLNFYLIDNAWHLVDLPGYGYAKISKKKRAEWEKMIHTYLKYREQMQCAMILIDANVPPQKIDVEFMNLLGEKGVPFVIVYTKVCLLYTSDAADE